MPEYLAPGVYIEETSFRSKSIEGVSTTTTGFIGPTRYGPLDLEPDIITSLGEFERIYGDRQQLVYSDAGTQHNFMWHAVRAFFEEGGKRLYIARVFKPAQNGDGRASAKTPAAALDANAVQIRARFPGSAGNMRVRFALRIGQNVLSGTAAQPTLRSVSDGDMVWVSDGIGDGGNPEVFTASTAGRLCRVRFNAQAQTFGIETYASPPVAVLVNPAQLDEVRVVTLAVTVTQVEGTTLVWDSLAPEPGHTRAGAPDSLTDKFAAEPDNLAQARTLPIVLVRGASLTNGLTVVQALFQETATIVANAAIVLQPAYETADISLAAGNDGERPGFTEYDGTANEAESTKTGLKMFEDIEDISIVAAPGSTFGFENGFGSEAQAIVNLLISHCQRMRYRIAVLDSGNGQAISQVRAMRAKLDSTYGALYYPWVRVLDPVTRREIYLPPSGFVAGIYARNDINRAVWKAPANEVVNGALGFEILLNKAQQDVLNPEGINCFRFFEGRGFRLWGARTISSDPEWKYVNLRRYFIYLERSIDRGTQWAVFEPNGEALWANVRRTIEDFMFNEWQMGALLGDKPEKAYFVRCDRSTMTQNDLDNGRLVCLIGVAPLRPAEFVIFRIGQWTGDRKV